MLTLNAVINLLVYWLSALVPRDRKLAVFGAWEGDRYCDNPKYLMLYLLNNTDYRCVWIGKAHLKEKLPEGNPNFLFVEQGSWRAMFYAIRAKFWFFCSELSDISKWSVFGGATRVNLWHGIPLKYMGDMSPYTRARIEARHGLRAVRHKIYDVLRPPFNFWSVSASNDMSRIMVESYPLRYAYNRMLPFGTPRNDFLVNNRDNGKLIGDIKRKYCRMLGVALDKKIVLYMPTWRMSSNSVFTFYGLEEEDQKQIAKLLNDNNAVLVEKHHHATFKKQPICPEAAKCSIVMTSALSELMDPQELYLIADILVTDYSSAYFDYAILKKPCIHFIYDYAEYRDNDSGLAYDLHEVAAGKCVSTITELKAELERQLLLPIFEPSNGLAALLMYETGNCAKQIVGFMKGAVP